MPYNELSYPFEAVYFPRWAKFISEAYSNWRTYLRGVFDSKPEKLNNIFLLCFTVYFIS